MKLRYGKRALHQIESALSYILERSPQGADNLRRRIVTIGALLEKNPRIGRPTSRPGVRRMSLSPFPYTMDYRIIDDEIVVQRFRHTARRPLP